MTEKLLQIPYGVQCFYGSAAHFRRSVERRVADVFSGWSYDEITLPLFDYYEVFDRGGGLTGTERIYRFIGRQGEILALRPDFTALVAKVVASRMAHRPLPLRLFYTGEVLRYQSPKAGRPEDLYQIGLEHIGDSLTADLEVLLVALEALERLGIQRSVLTVGHAGFVLGLLGNMDLTPETRCDVLEALRARDRDGLERALKRRAPASLFESMALSGGVEVLERARGISGRAESQAALDRLESLAQELSRLGVGPKIQFDLSEVLPFDYYTGMVFEIHAPGLGLPLGGGGRYDSLIGRFGRSYPAVGFSFSLDRIVQLVSKNKPRWAERPTPRTVPSSALAEALELRRKGQKVKVE
jgi:ATP phosphoribosyltransferase regulatory subunit